MFEAVYIKDKIYEHYIYIGHLHSVCLKPYLMILALICTKIDRDLKFLCFLPVAATHVCRTCVDAHAHVHGGHPNAPYPHKKFEGPNPIGS